MIKYIISVHVVTVTLIAHLLLVESFFFDSNPKPVQDTIANEARCLNCIRNISSILNIDTSKRCEDYFCGQFQYSYTYWAEAGKPGSNQSAKDFEKCARDRNCAQQTVIAYFKKYKRDCNNDGVIDCRDMAALHKAGPTSCSADWFYKSRYWLAFNKTTCMNSQLEDPNESNLNNRNDLNDQQQQSNYQQQQMKNQSLTSECLDCICDAVSGCNTSVNNCGSGTVCGPFAISQAYWKDGRRPGASWTACTRTKECSSVTIRNYMEKYKKDCNGDGYITCEDYAAIHRRGPRSCSNKDLYKEHYWNKFLACRANQKPVKDVNMVKVNENSQTEEQLVNQNQNSPVGSSVALQSAPTATLPPQMPTLAVAVSESGASQSSPTTQSINNSPTTQIISLNSNLNVPQAPTYELKSVIFAIKEDKTPTVKQQQQHDRFSPPLNIYGYQPMTSKSPQVLSSWQPTEQSTQAITGTSMDSTSQLAHPQTTSTTILVPASASSFPANQKSQHGNHASNGYQASSNHDREISPNHHHIISSTNQNQNNDPPLQAQPNSPPQDHSSQPPVNSGEEIDYPSMQDFPSSMHSAGELDGANSFDKVVTNLVGSPEFSNSYPPIPDIVMQGKHQTQTDAINLTQSLNEEQNQKTTATNNNQQVVQKSGNQPTGQSRGPSSVNRNGIQEASFLEPNVASTGNNEELDSKLNTPEQPKTLVSVKPKHQPQQQATDELAASSDGQATSALFGGENLNVTNLFEKGLNESSRIAGECLECICDASSNCDTTVQCISKQRDKNRCGLYMISWNQYQESDISLTSLVPLPQAGVSEELADERMYYECTTDRLCAERLIHLYVEKHQKDCNNDGKIDCYDIAAIHRVGPDQCNSGKFLSSQYWKDFNICYTTDRLAATTTTATTTTMTQASSTNSSS